MPAAECSDTATTTTSRGSREDCLINHDMTKGLISRVQS
jgi:hypothetical protein